MASVVAGKCCSFNRFKGVFSYRIVSRVAGVVLAPTRLKSYSVYMQHKKKRDSKNRTSLFLVAEEGFEPSTFRL